MFTAVKNLFSKISGKPEDKSGSTAANRMRLMLTHDRQEVSPGIMNQMKQEILEVISKYFDIDPQEAEFIIQANHFEAESIFSSKVPLLKGAKLRAEHMVAKSEGE
ncbi:MAG: cell division topological specificity factor MinE [Candidatus Caenarcaniphilales bacterium]|nr:cell division topological specificity factor MinE [Candidatus Caenarcaniphilales bacterium]